MADPAPATGGGPSFAGCCPLCGAEGVFQLEHAPIQAPRDFPCPSCGATVVFQAEASAILDEYERGQLVCLEELLTSPDFTDMAVLHIGRTGPIRNRLKRLNDYHETIFDPERQPGVTLIDRPELSNQDHQCFTFDDERFDLLVSSHVLEHVPDWRLALAEAFRVLRPGGRYVFSIPSRVLRPRSHRRAEVVHGEIVNIDEPRFHNSPSGEPALVFTDFGRDLVDAMEELGFVVSIRRPHRPIQAARVNFVVVAAKPGRPRGI